MGAFFGILFGFVVLGVAHVLGGGQITELLNLPAAIIVVGGTLSAAMVQSPREDFRQAMQLIGWSLKDSEPDVRDTIDHFKKWSRSSKVSGLVVLERQIDQVDDAFLKSGLQLLADAQPVSVVRSVLETEMIRLESRDLHASRVVESMGGYAPTLGIIGSVIGLIQVMSNLTDPDVLGQGIATAFVATIYGVGSANLILLPLAKKIKRMIIGRTEYYELIVDGMCYIAEGYGPSEVEQRLQGYLEDGRAKTSTGR